MRHSTKSQIPNPKSKHNYFTNHEGTENTEAKQVFLRDLRVSVVRDRDWDLGFWDLGFGICSCVATNVARSEGQSRSQRVVRAFACLVHIVRYVRSDFAEPE